MSVTSFPLGGLVTQPYRSSQRRDLARPEFAEAPSPEDTEFQRTEANSAQIEHGMPHRQ
jgi:hypothetical protein